MSVTLKVLIEGYLAAKDRPGDVPGRLVFWLEALGDLPITQITPDAVDSAIVRLAERGRLQPRRNSQHATTGRPLAGATLTRYVSQLAGLFKFARKQRLVPRTWTPPTRGMDLPEPAPIKTSYFTANDIDRLVKVARMLDTKWRRMPALIQVAFCTGLRAGMDKAEGGFTQAERGEALREGATKGAVITGVDALTLGVGGKVAKGLNKAAIEAGARAEARVLADAGVDLASREAIEKALAEPALREAAKAAGQQAAKQAASIKSKAATAGTGIAMETVGEGTGEYLGELAATGKADVYDAVMEAAAGMTQSGPETAWNMRKASGNDLDSRGIARAGAQAEPNGSPVAGGITNPAPDANQAGQRITAERAMDQQRAAESATPQDPASTGPQKRPQERLAELEIQGQTMGLTPALVSEKQAILEGMQTERADAPPVGIDQQPTDLTPAVGQAPAPSTAPATVQQTAPITNFWTYAKSKGYAPGQLRVGTPEHAAVKAEFDAQKTAPAAQRASILPTVATDQTSTAPANSATPAMGQDLSLQNRDRSRTASVVQMQDIANRPDYMRLGPSRSPDAGAPMVFAVADDISMHVPEGNEGRVDVAVMADGQRVPFRYAVVDASSVQPSNLADGSANPLFMDTEPGTLKALNNGRTAGLRAAYERGTAEDYRQELIADAAAHGVPVEAIARTPNPILVRVYSEASNTPDMATKSQGQGLGMSPGELARQDAPLIDASVLAVYQSTDVTSAANRDFVRAFVGKLLAAGQDVAPLMTAEGTLSPAGRTRIQAALMQAAYGDADMVQELFDSLDTDIKSIGEALKAVAGEWANMRDSARTGAINPDADITGNLLQAIALIRQSRRDRQALTEIVSQPDLMTGDVPDSLTVGLLRMFHTGPNLSRAAGRDRVVQDLRNYLGMAMATSAEPDMFGQTVAPFTIVQELTTSGDSNDKTATQESQGQPDSRPDAGGSAQAARQAVPGPVDDGNGPATGGNRPAEPETAAGPTGSSDAQAAQGDDPAQFQLSAPTPQVLRDIDASITAIEQQLAAQRQQEEQRAQADAERDSFTLTGSDRAADVAAARGQQDIFSNPKPDAPQPRNPAASGESRIEDVGQQLYANRRNFTGRGIKWADLEGLNDTLKLKEVTKAKVWPRPNYEQLVADGMSPLLARMVKQVYDGLSAGPTIRAGTPPTDEHLKRYIETLGKIREGLFAFVNDRQAVAEFAGAVLAQVKGSQAVAGPVAITDMLSQNVDAKAISEALIRRVWPDQYQGSMRAFARGTQAHADVAIIGGNKALSALQFVRQDFAKWAADLDKNWPTKREAWQVQGWRVLGPDEYTAVGQEQPDGSSRMSIRLKQGRGSWRADFSIEQLTKPTYLLVQEGGFTATTFETREAAIEAARAKVKRDVSIGQDIRGTNIEDAERTGPARREEGEDISAKGLMDAFGFRGVNFGREGWIKQAERQAYLNQAYDGLLDLAEVLGVPPKAMSLNGELGIAFGAQGKGKFAAHFVPGVNEINLTKTRGAGTLAHEWGHALDHYFGKQAGLAKDAEPFLSEHAYKGDKTDRMTFEGGRYVSQKGMATFGPEIRMEIVQAFRTIYQAMMKRAESVGEANILAHIAMQREAALTRGEKNHVVKKLYLMAAQNPDDEYWQIDAPPEIKTIDSRTGFVRTMVDPAYKHLPHVVMVRIGGRDQAIVFNEHNKEAVRLAQAMKNLDIDDLHVVLGLAAKGTRWFASVNTQYNPIFGLINFARDVQAGLLNLSTTELAGLEKAVASKIPTAMRAIYRERRGKVGANQTWTRLWDEFQDVGGTTGYRDMFTDAKERAKGLADELAAMDRGQASKAAHAVVDWLSDYNETMENAVRLAAYKVALDQGMTRERAASLAKNLTVNFNRKGRQAREIGALYAFFNAAIQGTVRMAETLKGPMGRRIMYGGVLLGAVNAMIGMAVMGGGDDDEPDRWEQVPEFIKERSIVIPLGRQDYLSIPLPLGFHVLPNMGRLAVEFALGDADKTAGRQLGKLLQVLADAFNPMGGSQNLGQMVAPTVIDPVVALMQNRDWTGKPIYRESNNPLDPQPGHKMAKDSASSPSRAIAEAINKVTGGTDYRPGAWSPTPDQLDYVIGQLTGGLGRELLKVNQTISATVTGDELPPYKVPLLGRLYGNTRGPAGQSEQFYENVKRLNEIENEIKGRYRNGQDAGAYRDSEPLSSLVPLANAMENQVRKLREIRRNLTERKPEGYQERVREVDQRIGQAMERLNAEVSKARK